MPWNPATKGYPDTGSPSHYSVPRCVCSFDVEELEYAKKQRKLVGQFREEILGYQKGCGKGDIEGARYFSGVAAELMKEYRGWDAAILWIEGFEGMNTWLHKKVAEPIAPYVDRAFGFIDIATKG